MGDINPNNNPASELQREVIKMLQSVIKHEASTDFYDGTFLLSLLVAIIPHPQLFNDASVWFFREIISNHFYAFKEDRLEASAETLVSVMLVAFISGIIGPRAVHRFLNDLPQEEKPVGSDHYAANCIDYSDPNLTFGQAIKQIELLGNIIIEIPNMHFDRQLKLTGFPMLACTLGVFAGISNNLIYQAGKLGLGVRLAHLYGKHCFNYGQKNRTQPIFQTTLQLAIEGIIKNLNAGNLNAKFSWEYINTEPVSGDFKIRLNYVDQSDPVKFAIFKDRIEAILTNDYSNTPQSLTRITRDAEIVFVFSSLDIDILKELQIKINAILPGVEETARLQNIAIEKDKHKSQQKQQFQAKKQPKLMTEAERIAEEARKQKEAEALKKSQEVYAKYAQEELERKQKEQELQAAKDKQTLENEAKAEAKLKAVMEEEKRRKKNAKRK